MVRGVQVLNLQVNVVRITGVQVFKLITKDTIEERIDWLIKDKLRLIDTLNTDEGPELFKNFTKKELLALVESLS